MGGSAVVTSAKSWPGFAYCLSLSAVEAVDIAGTAMTTMSLFWTSSCAEKRL